MPPTLTLLEQARDRVDEAIAYLRAEPHDPPGPAFRGPHLAVESIQLVLEWLGTLPAEPRFPWARACRPAWRLVGTLLDWTVARSYRPNEDPEASPLDDDLLEVGQALEKTKLGYELAEHEGMARAFDAYERYKAGFQALKELWRAGAASSEDRWGPYSRALELALDEPARFGVGEGFFDELSEALARDRARIDNDLALIPDPGDSIGNLRPESPSLEENNHAFQRALPRGTVAA